MLGKFIARDFIAIAGEMCQFPASNENTGVVDCNSIPSYHTLVVMTTAIKNIYENSDNCFLYKSIKFELNFIFQILKHF